MMARFGLLAIQPAQSLASRPFHTSTRPGSVCGAGGALLSRFDKPLQLGGRIDARRRRSCGWVAACRGEAPGPLRRRCMAHLQSLGGTLHTLPTHRRTNLFRELGGETTSDSVRHCSAEGLLAIAGDRLNDPLSAHASHDFSALPAASRWTMLFRSLFRGARMSAAAPSRCIWAERLKKSPHRRSRSLPRTSSGKAFCSGRAADPVRSHRGLHRANTCSGHIATCPTDLTVDMTDAHRSADRALCTRFPRLHSRAPRVRSGRTRGHGRKSSWRRYQWRSDELCDIFCFAPDYADIRPARRTFIFARRLPRPAGPCTVCAGSMPHGAPPLKT